MYNQNLFQRQTQNLHDEPIIKETTLLAKIPTFLHSHNFPSLLDNLAQLAQIKRDEERQNFNEQLFFQESLYMYLSGKERESMKNLHKSKIWTGNNFLKVRVKLFEIITKMEKGQNLGDDEINELIGRLNDDDKMKDEILIRLTGCKSFQRMKEITQQEIQQLTNSQLKKAFKFQRASDWKYFVNQPTQAISFKEKSLALFSSIDKLKNYKTCEEELKDMKQLVKGKKPKTIYAHKLMTILKICEEFYRIKSKIEESRVQNENKNLCRFVVGELLRDLENEEKKIKDSKLSTQKLKRNENILSERKKLGEQFHIQCMKNRYKYSRYLETSKLEQYGEMVLLQRTSIFDKLVKQHHRKLFNYLKENIEKGK